jgi:rhodanese-related sulfurtransferase
LGVAVTGLIPRPARAQCPEDRTVYQSALNEPNQTTSEITTEELLSIVAKGSPPVLDVRFAQEWAIAHIPGSINVYEKEVDQIAQLYPDRATTLILYCNGPFCGKSKRTSQDLVKLGYKDIRRYQLGMPVWRALGNTVETTLDGVRYVWNGDRTAVWVDAREAADFARGTLPGAVNVWAGQAETANEDGRLPLKDKGTRVIVFGSDAAQARTVAALIARKAYWNSSYFGGTVDQLLAAGLVRDPQRAALGEPTRP